MTKHTGTDPEAYAQLTAELAEIRSAAAEVVRISDRKHEAWDRLKAVMLASGSEVNDAPAE